MLYWEMANGIDWIGLDSRSGIGTGTRDQFEFNGRLQEKRINPSSLWLFYESRLEVLVEQYVLGDESTAQRNDKRNWWFKLMAKRLKTGTKTLNRREEEEEEEEEEITKVGLM
ncbi:hypothetical protein EYC80_001293 [Monilinia laxa]|uniref:Uncharacterized protein n=1 Tax=Monilinia laxa TaxID=61186 RepID=A0A5N6K8Z2_MONLA|nr:hypothetical protein EYC80_001293 [Monilinia laxa]